MLKLLSYFIGNFFYDDGFQNKFVYQPVFNMVDFKRENNEYETSAWISKGVYNSGFCH